MENRFLGFLAMMEAECPDSIFEEARFLYHAIMEASFMPRDAVIQTTADPLVSGGSKNTPIPNSSDADTSRGEYPNPAVPGTCTKENPKCVSEMPAFAKGPSAAPRANWFNASFTTNELIDRSSGFSPNTNLAAPELQQTNTHTATRDAIKNAEKRIPVSNGDEVIEDAVPKSGMFPMTGININAGFGTHTSTDVGYQGGGSGSGSASAGEG